MDTQTSQWCKAFLVPVMTTKNSPAGRSAAWALVVVVLLLVTGCRGAEPAAEVIPEGGSYRIDPFKEGSCSFDTRSGLLQVDSAGSVVWQLDVPFSWSNELLVQDGIGVLEVENGGVAFDIDSGRPLWQLDDKSNWRAVLASSVVALVNPSRQQVVGVDWQSGSTLWTYESDKAMAYGGATNGSSVFINTGGFIVALNAETGTAVWERETVGDASYPPQFKEGMLLHPAFEGVLYRLDPDTGRILWEWNAPDEAIAVTDGIDVSEGVILVTTAGWSGPSGELEPPLDASQLVALDAESGTLLWSTALAEGEIGPEAVHTPGSLVYATNGIVVIHRPLADRLEALSIESGETIWEYPTPSDEAFSASSAGRVLFIGFGSRQGKEASVRAIGLGDGATLWTSAIDFASNVTVMSTDDSVFAYISRSVDSDDITSDSQGSIFWVDTKTGQTLWSLETSEAVEQVIEDGGHLTVVASDPSVGCA
jgi:outer membrane protein assembly factor BamB